MDYKTFVDKSEQLRIEREQLIDELVSVMGGKVRYYSILAIADECKPFFSDNIPKQILDILRNETELNIYKKIVDNKIAFDDIWSQYRTGA